jgi:steroid delta-isomerase-like uncharacterized protein
MSPAESARFAFESIGRRDISYADEVYDEGVFEHFLPLEPLYGRQATKAHFEQLFAAIPELTMKVEEIVGEGRFVAVRWHMWGSFIGEPFYGIRANGSAIDLQGVDFIRYDDHGRIEHNEIFFDGAEFMRQVGGLPPRNSICERLVIAVLNLAAPFGRWRARRRLAASTDD